jgi:hypothetical protein
MSLGINSWWPAYLDKLLGTTAARPVPTFTHIEVTGDPAEVRDAVRDAVNGNRQPRHAVVARERDEWKAKARLLSRQYGRASRTIGEQRGTIASLRAQLAAALCNETPDPAADEWSGAVGKPGRVDGDDQAAAGTPAGGAGERPPAGTDPERMLTPRQERDMRCLLGLDPEPFDHHVDRIGDDLAALGLLKPAPGARDTVVRVLTDHELLADDTCRCGWGTRHYTDPPCDPLCAENPLWHAEHVAMELAAQGVTGGRIAPRARYVFGHEAADMPVGTVLLLDVQPPVQTPVIRGHRGWIDPDDFDEPRDLHQTSRFRVLYRPEATK